MGMKDFVKNILLKLGLEIRRHQPRAPENLVVSLCPKGANTGNVLLSYDVLPFLAKNDDPLFNSHNGYVESLQIATTFLDLGYCVDVINYNNDKFLPKKNYSLFVGMERNFERLSKLCSDDCIKVLYMVWAHWAFHNSSQYERILALKQRKGIVLKPRRQHVPTLAIENADYAITIGNEFAANTCSYANKPIFHIHNLTTAVYDWPADKTFDACQNNFLWFGGSGLIHKGLDLVLDAFRELPNHHLTICGPLDEEEDFKKSYYKELFETANIHTIGWVDVKSPEFIKIANSCIGVICASCSENAPGSIIVCMHAGLIPIVSYESSLEVGDYGIILKNCSVDTIKDTIQMVSSLSKEELKSRARKAWEYARANYTKERHAEEFRKVIENIIATRNNIDSRARL
jgi:glycosyltransferase involved in cell wall biosynthesis